MGDFLQERNDRILTDANQVAETLKVQGDTNNRYQQRPDGKQEWGSGSATPDTNLYRLAANVLGTDDLLTGLGGLREGTEAASTGEGATLVNYGLSLVASSSDKSLTLTNPSYAGQLKSIYCTNASSAAAIISLFTASTSVAFDAVGSTGATPKRKILFRNTTSVAESVNLRSFSDTNGTLQWAFLGGIGSSMEPKTT